MEMANKVAVVTGGSGGIGRAMGKAFLAEGAEAVVLADLDANAVEGVACEIGSDGQVCDVTNEAQVQALVDKTLTRYGRIDLFCSNTPMAPRSLGDGQTDGIIEPEELAQTVVAAIREERFYVLPHPEVENYVRRKGNDIDRWLSGMRRLRRRSTHV